MARENHVRRVAAKMALLGPVLALVAAENGCKRDCSYPDAPAGATSLAYVCPGSGGVGTESDPYGSLADAIAESPAGTTLLLAAGSYAENVTVDKALTLVGSNDANALDAEVACLEAPAPHALVVSGAVGVQLIGLCVRGSSGTGIWLRQGARATVRGAHIEGVGAPYGYGVAATEASQLTLTGSVVTGSAGVGIYLGDAVGIIDDNNIDANTGGGVFAGRSELTLTASRLSGNLGYGVFAAEAHAIIDDNNIGATGVGGGTAEGVVVYGPAGGAQASIELRRTTIAGSGQAGVLVDGDAVGIIDDNNIDANGTAALGSLPSVGGAGVWLQNAAGANGTLQVSNNRLTGNRYLGIGVCLGAVAVVSGNDVGDTAMGELLLAPGNGKPGDGIGLFDGAAASVENNDVHGSYRAGIFTVAADGTATSIAGNTVTGNAYAIVLQSQEASPVTVDASNTYTANTQGNDVKTFATGDPGALSRVPADAVQAPGEATALQ